MTQWGLDAVFNPAKRHMDEEKQRLQMTRQETGDSSGGDRIDLESGKVVIRRQASETADAEATDTEDEDQRETSAPEAPETETDEAVSEDAAGE